MPEYINISNAKARNHRHSNYSKCGMGKETQVEGKKGDSFEDDSWRFTTPIKRRFAGRSDRFPNRLALASPATVPIALDLGGVRHVKSYIII